MLLVSNVLEIPVVFIEYIRGIRTAHVNDKILLLLTSFGSYQNKSPLAGHAF